MRNSRTRLALGAATLIAVFVAAPCARAQTPKPTAKPVQGFGVDRFDAAPAGAGWFVMDRIAMHGTIGGAAAVTFDYAHNPLRIASSDGSGQPIAVVSQQAFVDFAFSATYDRIRLSLALEAPVLSQGDSGISGGHSYTAPNFDLGSHPDTLSDVRLGIDTRVFGEYDAPFRLGIGAQLSIPSGERADYVSDHTYQAAGRIMVAGDLGPFQYAGHVGLHIRPLDNASDPGSPQGNEFFFGVAAGLKLPVCIPGTCKAVQMILGPEVYGATALLSFFDTDETALEGLLSMRFEGTKPHGAQLRVKLGAGGGLNPHFGAPDARVLFGIEVFDRSEK